MRRRRTPRRRRPRAMLRPPRFPSPSPSILAPTSRHMHTRTRRPNRRPPPPRGRRGRPPRPGPPRQYGPRPRGPTTVRPDRPVMQVSQEPPPPITKLITLAEGMTVKDLADKLEVKIKDVFKKLIDRR